MSKNEKNILVVGTGGIGCELLKLLSTSEKSKITLIDFDTIELTNLNRQFFFIEQDIGKFKSQVVGEKIRNLTNWDITILTDSIFNYDLQFFEKFDIVYNCLDNNETRSYVNLRCFLGKIKLIDGGSGGFKGQSCVFDFSKECFDCLPKQSKKTYNVCTIRTIPTKFEHCIEFVKSTIFDDKFDFKKLYKLSTKKFYKKFIVKNLILKNTSDDVSDKNNFFKKINKDVKKCLKYLLCIIKKHGKILPYDKDNVLSTKLLYKFSCIRSKSANIKIMNYFDFQSIANNIIPSLCTTNSIVASLMLLSEKSNKHFFLTLSKKLFLSIDQNEKNFNCLVCSKKWIKLIFKEKSTALDLFVFLNEYFKIRCEYLMIQDNILYSKFPYNLDDILDIPTNSTGTLGCNEGVFKIYILKFGENFDILN